MAKLASAREIRLYGPHRVRHRWEYINAGLYVFAAVLLAAGFSAQLPGRGDAKVGLVVVLVGLAIVAAVNGHDLIAHLAGVDFRLGLVQYDLQLLLVEFAVPLVQLVGSVLSFAGILFLLIQDSRGYDYKLEKHALNLLIAGPLFWLIGSIHNACQIYERADGDTQMLQASVYLPLLMGSLLFFVGGIFNRHAVYGSKQHHFRIMSKSWAWFSLFGSLLFLIGGLMNVLKVFRMQRPEVLRLEKLRGGAQERLSRDREGRIPILEDNRRPRLGEEARPPIPIPRPPARI